MDNEGNLVSFCFEEGIPVYKTTVHHLLMKQRRDLLVPQFDKRVGVYAGHFRRPMERMTRHSEFHRIIG